MAEGPYEHAEEASSLSETAFRIAEKKYQLHMQQRLKKTKNGRVRGGKLVAQPTDLSRATAAAMNGPPGDWRRPSRSVMTKMMKESVKTGHPTGLPEKLVRLFAPGPPLRFIAENAKPKKKPKLPYTGIGSLVAQFASPGDAEYEPPSAATSGELPQPRLFRNKELELQVRLDDETKLEKKKRLHDWKVEKNKKELEEKAATFNPADDPMIEGDAYKTLFVPRLSYEVTERKLRHEFEEFGPIKRIRLVHDRNTDKPRGYAFIEYEHKKDMKEAYKNADGRKVEGRRILVDVERGRTVDNWRPMRLGGGLGGDTRAAKEPRKKLMAEAAARGTTLPPAEAPIRREDPRGPPRDYERGPPADYRGGGGRDMRGPPPDRFADRGPPRGGGYEGSRDRDRDRGRDRDFGRERERSDRDKRPREASPGRDYKRGRHEEERPRGRDRDY
ncbi:hypothetical protein OEZ85_005807 [Tetradesmus obliquus]|uniref:RRM domain-containing protein n=1 Tax=Tetradesmus obliquus TaxID=3088 RepID=A0ABY8UEM8_TETOB|nr:hypothetical protein OEZ85_005807 [Tetradesmus obliquus]